MHEVQFAPRECDSLRSVAAFSPGISRPASLHRDIPVTGMKVANISLVGLMAA
ncbi:hypothetical protein [Burkholderia sp. BCC0506]|uniref:hypothetical protein n=1 Tax=Burkholderia sp. BCC0506 TaxID=2676290 RepID=UPI001ABA7E16|nr:hypothetical protein [Burkholderia sp. BCC0506]